MKKTLAAVLALCLLLCSLSALADTVVTKVDTGLYRPYLNSYTNTLYGRTNRNSLYGIFDLQGNQLSDELYADITSKEFGFVVQNESGVNKKGFLDGNGKLLIPLEYGDVDVFSAKWQAGVMMVPATSDNYDYKSYGSDSQFFLIDTVDIYFEGAKVGTLSREQYNDYPYAHGDYLYMKDREGKWHFYNSKLEESGYQTDYGSSEYDSIYKKGSYTYYHCGSGQQAFTAGCTLTPEEVERSVMENRGNLIDLQGNVIATLQYDYIYSFENGYARVKNRQGLYGLINEQGQEVLPCLYDDMDYSGPSCGYVSVVKDGKQGFVSIVDGTETGFVYAEAAVKVRSPFAFVTDLDGSIIVATGAAGVLDTHYQDYTASYGAESPVIVVQDKDGNAGVIGLMGEELIPCDGTYDRTYDLDLSRDGKVILDNEGLVYLIDYDLTALPAAPASAPAAEEAAAGDGWVCPVCGNANDADANFCPKDATPRPAAEWVCPKCGKTNPADANFCPQDATPKP